MGGGWWGVMAGIRTSSGGGGGGVTERLPSETAVRKANNLTAPSASAETVSPEEMPENKLNGKKTGEIFSRPESMKDDSR